MNRIIAGALRAAFATGIAACADTSPSAPDETSPNLPAGIFVSNPGSTVSKGAYVSAAPGTFAGASAKVRNTTREGATQSAMLIEGGFDPIRVDAEVGDELSLTIFPDNGGSTSMVVKVPPRRPPDVVRTTPARGRTEVLLTVPVLVVFSEPVDVSTVTSGSISLLENGKSVLAGARLSEDGLTAELIPENPLKPQTSYALGVNQAIRDRDGDALRDAFTATFTTAPNLAQPDASIAGFTFLFAINDNGTVLGSSLAGGRGWDYMLWRQGVVTHLPTFATGAQSLKFGHAAALNADGVVAGIGPVTESYQGRMISSGHGMQWKAGVMTDLGALAGHNWSEAVGINDEGVIVGSSGSFDGGWDSDVADTHAVVWKNGVITALGTLPGDTGSYGRAINGLGQVVGTSNPSGRVVLWTNGVPTPLRGGFMDDEPAVSGYSSPVAINDRGQITGTRCAPPFGGQCRAFVWQANQVRLLDLPSGCNAAEAFAIDETGRVAGDGYQCGKPFMRAVVWVEGKVIELGAPAAEDSRALGISGSGQVIGWTARNGGPSKGSIWKLEPNP